MCTHGIVLRERVILFRVITLFLTENFFSSEKFGYLSLSQKRESPSLHDFMKFVAQCVWADIGLYSCGFLTFLVQIVS